MRNYHYRARSGGGAHILTQDVEAANVERTVSGIGPMVTVKIQDRAHLRLGDVPNLFDTSRGDQPLAGIYRKKVRILLNNREKG